MEQWLSVRFPILSLRNSTFPKFRTVSPNIRFKMKNDVLFSTAQVRIVAQTYVRPKLNNIFCFFLHFWVKFLAYRPFELGKYTVVHGEFESDLRNTSFFYPGSEN